MRAVHGLTAAGGTFATYSAAGWVRRNLEAAGFEVERIKGFAGKRQMMRGIRR
ncbi:MnmC family methyltransferase [Pannonibacter sp. Pt2-lr]